MESGKGDDPCVTFESPCGISAGFTEEQLIKITQKMLCKEAEERLLKMMNSTSYGMRTLSTLRVLQTICLPPLHVLSPYPPSHCLITPEKYVPPTPGTALTAEDRVPG